MASSRESTAIRYRMGPKVSAWTMGQSLRARIRVGSTKWPGPGRVRPPKRTSPPVCRPVDEGTHERRGVERVPDAYLTVGVNEAALQIRGNALVDEYAAGARAALAGSADRAEDDRRH